MKRIEVLELPCAINKKEEKNLLMQSSAVTLPTVQTKQNMPNRIAGEKSIAFFLLLLLSFHLLTLSMLTFVSSSSILPKKPWIYY